MSITNLNLYTEVLVEKYNKNGKKDFYMYDEQYEELYKYKRCKIVKFNIPYFKYGNC